MKKRIDPRKQVIAYTSDRPPPGLPGEPRLNKDPIKIETVNAQEKLDPASRIDLEKLHNVEHNVSICRVGDVNQNDLRRLKRYWGNQLDEEKFKLEQSMEKIGRPRGRDA